MKHLVSLREVNHHFSQYIHFIEKGDEVIITRRGKPIVKMIAMKQEVHLTAQQKKSRENLLALMERGLSLKGETFNRSDLHER